MQEEEGVEARDPLIRLRLEKFPGHPRDHALRRNLLKADLLPQVSPQHGGMVLGDRVMREPHRAIRAVERAELTRVDKLGQVRALGQLQLPSRAVTASRAVAARAS